MKMIVKQNEIDVVYYGHEDASMLIVSAPEWFLELLKERELFIKDCKLYRVIRCGSFLKGFEEVERGIYMYQRNGKIEKLTPSELRKIYTEKERGWKRIKQKIFG